MISRAKELARDSGSRLQVRAAREAEQLSLIGKRIVANGLRVAAA